LQCLRDAKKFFLRILESKCDTAHHGSKHAIEIAKTEAVRKPTHLTVTNVKSEGNGREGV